VTQYLRFLFILYVLSFISSSEAAQNKPAQPAGWDSNLKLAEAVDSNPDPGIVEVSLEARLADVNVGGRTVKAWTYNGSVPGPLIRTKVGDRLIVHFTNQLPSATTVHWHGVRVPIEMDGVPGISQPPVSQGFSFTYDFEVHDAGLFWYHPHVDSAAQVGFGLSRPLLVEDPAEQVGAPDQLVLVLNDLEVDEKGALASPDSGGSVAMAFGREGNVVLVNGKQNPAIAARAGVPQRWRIVNTAKSRFFNIHLREGDTTFRKIGGDGGLQEYPTVEETIVVAPGERADVIVVPKGKPGTEIQVMSELFNRGYGSVEYRDPEKLFTIAFSNLPVYTASALPKIGRKIEPLRKEGATPIPVELSVTENNFTRAFEYRINGKVGGKAKPIPARIGETQLWTVSNTTPWSHPMHLHGFFFQVLDQKGEPVRPLEWKDTVSVPYNQTLQLLVRFDDRPGNWMVHCHILDHAEGGLMTTVQLGDVTSRAHSHVP
jgi:FtsP/CotA-like multicopper oxidase with cupredoxin domain